MFAALNHCTFYTTEQPKQLQPKLFLTSSDGWNPIIDFFAQFLQILKGKVQLWQSSSFWTFVIHFMLYFIPILFWFLPHFLPVGSHLIFLFYRPWFTGCVVWKSWRLHYPTYWWIQSILAKLKSLICGHELSLKPFSTQLKADSIVSNKRTGQFHVQSEPISDPF